MGNKERAYHVGFVYQTVSRLAQNLICMQCFFCNRSKINVSIELTIKQYVGNSNPLVKGITNGKPRVSYSLLFSVLTKIIDYIILFCIDYQFVTLY